MQTLSSDQLVAVLEECEPTIRGRFTRKLSKIGQRFDADDLVQTTRMKAFAAIEKCRAADDFELRNWVLQIAKNAYRTEIDNHVGRGKRSVKREVESDDVLLTRPSLNAVDATEVSESCSEVVAMLDELPTNQARAVRAVYLEGRDYPELADEMGVSVNSVRLLVSRGLKLIRQLTVPYGFELAADGTIVENPAEQLVLAKIRELKSRGWSYERINEAVTTLRLTARRGMAWSPAKIRSILNDH